MTNKRKTVRTEKYINNLYNKTLQVTPTPAKYNKKIAVYLFIF